MDVAIAVDPGPRAPFGTVSVSGKSNVDPAVVRSHVYIEPGDPYSPTTIADSRKSMLKLPAISSVRMHEAKALDANGRLPITAEVTDRKPHVIGFSARYSTLDGPDVSAYWQHRNLFGGAESLRLEGDVFLPPQTNGSFIDNLTRSDWSDLGGRFKASFVKPALARYAQRSAARRHDRKRSHRRRPLRRLYRTARPASAAIRHRFSGSSSAQIGFSAEKGGTTDSLGTVDYRLYGIPASATYDSTDRPLDPTRGVRATGSIAAYPTFFGSSVGLVESKAQGSTYYAVDDDAKLVLAGRAALGSVAGAELADIPSTHRFYAGGGGSVRGYRYRSLSPLGPTKAK